MAYFDRSKAIHEENCLDSYTKLKSHICSKDIDGKLNEFYLAYEHMLKMEQENKDLKEQLKKYQDFFKNLNALMPKTPSVFDVIG